MRKQTKEEKTLEILRGEETEEYDMERLAQIVRQFQATEKIERIIQLPNNVAFRMCWRSIYIRLGRAAITASGVFLGIAFFASVMTSAAIMRAAQETPDLSLQARQIWLVVMALLVSVVGIANSMLMSVTERFREIGTMKCLGALDRFIVKLFLFESALLGFLGSLLGGILGILSMWLVYSFKYNFVPPLGEFVLILGWSVVLGTFLAIIAAILPAMQAAKMPAAAALRVEV
ncbi:MAG TPA: FtsX-like permease family protein [Armatimonadetes bacterium]|nr:FtsX-like permease family protein [Armatimonadota bacterium]